MHILYQRIGKEYVSTLIAPALLSSVKDVVGKVEADKFINNRELVTEEIKQKLSAALNGTNVIVQSVSIEDIAFSGAFEAAIEAKQIATQEAIKSQNETVRVEEEGKQQVIKARAESDSKKAQSDADAYAIEVESKAKADAIRQMGLAEAEAIREKSKALAQNAKLVELTKAEKVKVALPSYIPTILFGAATVTCIVGANILNKRHQATLVSAYGLLDQSYKKYKKKVEELYGEDADNNVKDGIAKDDYEEAKHDLSGDKELFYDEFSGRYFESTALNVQQAEYYLNRDLAMRDYAYVNEFYEWLDLPPFEGGDAFGWSTGACLDMY